MGFENGKLVRVTLRASTGTREQVNTFHYDLIDDFGQPANDPQSLADFFRDNVIPKFQALYAGSWTIDPVIVAQELDPQNPTNPRSAWSSGTGTTGTHSFGDDSLPLAQCVVATLNTAHIGRRFRGRTFIGGSWSEVDNSSGGVPASALLTGTGRVNAYMNAIPKQPDIASGVSTSVANWCVYSRTQRAANLDPYASAVTTYVLRDVWHWLRRRR